MQSDKEGDGTDVLRIVALLVVIFGPPVLLIGYCWFFTSMPLITTQSITVSRPAGIIPSVGPIVFVWLFLSTLPFIAAYAPRRI